MSTFHKPQSAVALSIQDRADLQQLAALSGLVLPGQVLEAVLDLLQAGAGGIEIVRLLKAATARQSSGAPKSTFAAAR